MKFPAVVVFCAASVLLGGCFEGKQGPPGPAGKDGVPGIAGIVGKDGAPGKDGTPGKDGATGKDGTSGKDGAAGKDGVSGASGAPGKDGTTFRVLSGKSQDTCDIDAEIMIAAYCRAPGSEVTQAPVIVPPNGARCGGDTNVVMTCAKK